MECRKKALFLLVLNCCEQKNTKIQPLIFVFSYISLIFALSKTNVMKIIQSSYFRAFCALVIGTLILLRPDSTVKGITIGIGVLFLVSGVISCIAYWNDRQRLLEEKSALAPTIPVVGIRSTVFGLLLALVPGWFDKGLMYVLGAIVILGAINQFMALVQARKYVELGLGFWILPTVLLLTGIFIIVKPMESASIPLIILGICLIAYGISEIVNASAIHSGQKSNLPARRDETKGNRSSSSSAKDDDNEYVEYEEVD